MVKPYSSDLRERVVGRVLAGEPVRTVAEVFSIGAATAVRWSQRKRRTGSVAPDKMGGHRERLLAGERTWLSARIAAEPHVTLRRLQAELAERGIVASYGAVWNAVHALGLSFKKNRARSRAAKTGRRQAAPAVEKIPAKA